MSEFECGKCGSQRTVERCIPCERMKQFFLLEDMQLRLGDELGERISELEFAKQGIKQYEEAVAEARKRLKENGIAMRDFNWTIE